MNIRFRRLPYRYQMPFSRKRSGRIADSLLFKRNPVFIAALQINQGFSQHILYLQPCIYRFLRTFHNKPVSRFIFPIYHKARFFLSLILRLQAAIRPNPFNCKHFFPFPARTTVRAAAYGGISFMEEWRLPFFSTNHRFVHASSFRRLWRHSILKKPFRTRCGKAFHVQPVSLTGAVFRYKPGYRRPHTERVRSRSRKRRMPGIRQVPADPQQLPSGQPESLR